MSDPTTEPFLARLSSVYLSVLALFCFKLFIKVSLNLLTYFYIIRGNRTEAARISAQLYGYGTQKCCADRSPLHDAAAQGRSQVLKTLLSQGHDVNTVTFDRVTPLHEACLGDHVSCVRALVDAGANVDARTLDGSSPLFCACAAGSVACTEALLEHGARPQGLVVQPSPVHEASRKGHSGCLEVLLAWGADPDLECPQQGTPLYTACVCHELQCVRQLLRDGCDLQKGRLHDSPLHAAAERDFTAIVKLLLDFGADMNARNAAFQRPAEVAPPGGPTEGLLLVYEASPRALGQLCRQNIRSCVGRYRLHLLHLLHLPNPLKNFLLYK